MIMASFVRDFAALLEGIVGVRVVAEAQNGREAWELIRLLRPTLALVDVSMPFLNGIELTARVAAKLPSTRVLVLSMHAGEDYVLRAVKAGAAGYLLKDTRLTDLSGRFAPSRAARPISTSREEVTSRNYSQPGRPNRPASRA